ncbi:hypothetical protein Tamer19_67760 [Cupriavidus sp. TA19]|uniref:hypothetical protein n=1 Tax=unclassified Cupriavidus TaxID=2640874 RepID=UPI0027294B39|nr:hypothetical protein [Cupriavidus sp. TA19]GLC97367.1 hypothetical protein Tamer19_67760 [Cupriavidus sp. TA19]
MAHDPGDAKPAPDKCDALGLSVLALARHRSRDRLTLSRSTLVGILLVPVAFNLAEWGLSDRLSASWAKVLAFWLDKLHIDGTVVERTTPLVWFDVTLPYLDVAANAPDSQTWLATFVITLAAGVLAPRINDQYLPLRYFLLFAVFIQVTALLYFAVAPQSFPYTVSGYVDNGIKTSAGFLLLLPWGHALVYYIFDFSWSKKAFLTVLSIAFVVLAVPLQMTLHVYLLSCCSLLMMPLLSFVFGPTMIVFGCIALYGWAMSWERKAR